MVGALRCCQGVSRMRTSYPPEKVFLGAHGNLHPSIPVDIAQAHVMTASLRIATGKDMSIPGVGRVGVLGNTQPGDGVRDASCRFKIVDDDIVSAVLVHICR